MTKSRSFMFLGAIAICALASGALAGISAAKPLTRVANQIYIAGVSPFSTDPSLIPTSCGAQAEFAKLGYKWTWGGPTGFDVPGELSYLNSISLLNPAGVILLPLSPTVFLQKVKALMSAGVPIDMTDGALTPFVAHRSYQSDFSHAGSQVANGVLQITGGTGTVGVIAQAAGLALDTVRWQPAVKLLSSHKGIKVLPVQYAQANTVKAASEAAAMLRGNPDLKVIVATNGPQALGVVSAVAAAGDKGKVQIISFDSPSQVLTAIAQGSVAFTIAQAPFLKGADAAKDIISYIKAHGVRSGPVAIGTPSIVNIPTKVLTKANINTPAAKGYEDASSCSFFKGVTP